MSKPVINYVCSLGSFCYSSQFFKNHGLKKCSYPFDWIFCNNSLKTVVDCILDSFKKFLDPNNQIEFSPYEVGTDNSRRSGHKIYGSNLSPHFNLRNNSNYDYFVRCVERFENLL